MSKIFCTFAPSNSTALETYMIMKNKILHGAMLLCACVFSLQLNAQLTVTSTGDVNISKHVAINGTNIEDSVALRTKVVASSAPHDYGIYSTANALPSFAGGTGCNACVVGQILPSQYGKAQGRLLKPFQVGIAGLAAEGVAVYGTTSSSLPTLWMTGTYAGYFSGDVRVTGTVTCTSLTQTSDALTKNNVTYLQDNALNSIMRLKPISFYYNLDNKLFNSENAQSPAAQQMHYGFIAQELQEVLPEIVYVGQDSLLSINYVELIPLLVQTLQYQETRIDALEKTIVALASQASTDKAPRKINNNDISTQSVLYQNTPNPFSRDTRIAYELPLDTHDATLYIYDANGSQLESYPISEFGSNSVTVSGGHLPAGMYLYSLIADGQVVDTKRMILTK